MLERQVGTNNMKTLALAFFVFCVATLCRAANPSLENFDQLYFKTNAPAPGIIQTRMNTNQFRSPVLPGDTWTITNVTGLTGASHWTNVSGVLQPVDGSSVLVTNLTATSNTVNVGTMTWLSKSIVLTNGVNYLPSGKYSQLQLVSPSTDPSLVQIVLSNGWNTVQHLEIFNLTNAVPSQGAFTLTNLTPIPDSLGGGVVKLINNENWVATNGCGIELRFISPDWVEQFRSDVSGNAVFVTNYFNNVIINSNLTAHVIRINNTIITTNTLWETNIVAGTTNLQPVDSTVAVTVPNGLFIGVNSLLHYAGMGAADDIVSYKNSTNGATEHTITLRSRWDAANITGRFILDGDTNNFSILSSVIGNDGQGYGFQWGVGDSSNTILETKLNNSVVGWSLRPGVADGSTPFSLGTYATHTTGNLFELSNNTTNRVVVTPLSTLIGSPVTSPNFSVPAALEVSNFQDRGKALTVDIKLGASGNNDDYPVYFYSQITNSSAHPTINMEEVSPSGYIGGAHTLLSVQETPKVTNTVSTWPTYAAASTTAGYFNAAPTGGTNGAAMGLQGSVDPTRNFINIGVGSYVEATTDNLAATNIAFSGTVNQVLGTQKAVGGLFEIGSLANIPAIPSSAGVLIDGHNSGAPLIIAQTNGAVQFKVAANSGYAGTGTTFLADDGTYKVAGGGGGNMTNSGASVVGMVPVATDTSGGNWTPTNKITLNTVSAAIVNILATNVAAITVPLRVYGEASGQEQENMAWGIGNLGNLDSLSKGNIAIGKNAMINFMTNATYNTAIGLYAGKNITTGNGNTLYGTDAGNSITTGSDNVALGHNAGGLNTNGVSNIAIGTSALSHDLTAGYNTAVGDSALTLYTNAYATAVGALALSSAVDPLYMTGVGYKAGAAATGRDFTGMGFQAYYRGTGRWATMIGAEIAQAVTSADNNTGVGAGGLNALTSGANVTGVGAFVMNNLTTGSDNTAVGYAAGNVETVGKQSTFLGSGANSSANNVTNGIAIGYGTIVTNNNSTVLGNTSTTATYLQGNVYAIGGLLSTRVLLAKTTNYTATTANLGTVFSNFGTSQQVTNTLPSAVAGYTYTFLVEATNGVQVVAAAGNRIQIAASQSADGGNIVSTNIGNVVTLCVGASGTNWFAISHEGTWTVN